MSDQNNTVSAGKPARLDVLGEQVRLVTSELQQRVLVQLRRSGSDVAHGAAPEQVPAEGWVP